MTTLGLIVGTRASFPTDVVLEDRRKLIALLEELGFGVCVPEEAFTPFGAVGSLADAEKWAAFFRGHSEEIDGFLISLPNFGDETAVTETVRRSALRVPILIHGAADDLDRLMAHQRRGSFCGKISVCNNLYQSGIPFTLTGKHVCRVEDPSLREDLLRFEKVCAVVKKLSHATVGALGCRPAGFNTLRYSEKILLQNGIFTITEDFSEILECARRVEDADRIRRHKEKILAYAEPHVAMKEESLEKIARLDIVLDDWVRDHGVDATAMMCWSTVEHYFGCAPCTTMALQLDRGIPSGCEMDVLSALTSLAMLQAGGDAPPMVHDWFASYEDDPDACICIHCSNFSKEVFTEKPSIGTQGGQARLYGDDCCYGCLKGRIRPGEVTVCKITTDDRQGVMKAYIAEGEILEREVKTYSPYIVLHVDGLKDLMDHLCKNGFEHHFCVMHGRVGDVLEEAFKTYLGYQVYRHRA